MRIVEKSFIYASLLGLSACASVIEGSTDHINVSTAPATQANCSLTNSRGTVTSYTPATVAIKKSRSDLNVSCADARTGLSGQSTLESDVEAWDFGNIIIGGLIGVGVDWYTGAAYDYPDQLVVPVAAPIGFSTPAPAMIQTAPLAAPASTVVVQPAVPATAIAPQPAMVAPSAPAVAVQPVAPSVQPTAPVAQPIAPAPISAVPSDVYNPNYSQQPVMMAPAAAPVIAPAPFTKPEPLQPLRY